MKSFFSHPTTRHILIIITLFGLAGFIIFPDSAHAVVLFGTGIVFLATGLGHVVRKILFPYIDGKELIAKVKENAIACAIVICGIIYLSCTIITALVALLR